MKKLSKNFLLVILILFTISALFALFSDPFNQIERVSLSELAKNINDDEVEKVVVSGTKLTITYKSGGEDETIKESTKETEGQLAGTLLDLGVSQEALHKVNIEPREKTGFAAFAGPLAFVMLPLLILLVFFWFMFRQAKGGIGQAFDFTKARAKLFGADGQPKQKVSFRDVAGLQEAKEEVQEVVDFLKFPKKYLEMGAKIPRGVLLVGPPGTGKTLLAKAVASEAGVAFFSASGSEFIEMFVGVGSSRVRDLFATAKKAGKAIVFIDELDAIGRTRGFGFGGGHDEREQTLNQILVELDGFERNDTVIVMAATNRPDVLDPALLRPGRFDRTIVLDLPDVHDREAILKIHAEGKPFTQNVNLRELGERTPGFSGADLANLMNEAAILAARRNKTKISQDELLESIDKALLGPERKSHMLSKKEKQITAYHEAGHALVAASLKNVDPVRKISIISRGRAGGYTLKLPSEDKHMKSRAEFIDELSVLLGGYVAEKMIFGDITTGPSNDLEKASEIARSIIKDYGMSEKLGPVTFNEQEGTPFLTGSMGTGKNYSEATALEIDKEVSRLIEDARKVTERILRQKRKTLDKIAKVLIQKETIERTEFEQLVGIKTSAQKGASSSVG